MRDDVALLFEALLPLQRKKLFHIEKLYFSNCEKRNLLKSGAQEEAARIAEKDVLLIEEIDLIDAEMAKIKDEISRKCGISPVDFNKWFSSVSHPLVDDFFNIDAQISQTAKKAKSENASYLKDLESELAKTGNDIKELRRIAMLTGKIRDLR